MTVKETTSKSESQQSEQVSIAGKHAHQEVNPNCSIFYLPNDDKPASPSSPVIDEEMAATDISNQSSSSNVEDSNNAAVVVKSISEQGNEQQPSQRESRFSKHRRYQMYGLIMAGIISIAASLFIGGLIVSSVEEWKSVDDGTPVSAGEIVLVRYDYCGESDIKPLEPGTFSRCEDIYVCTFDFDYVFLVGDSLYEGSGTIKTDYEEEDCYFDVVNERNDLVNRRQPLTIYYDARDPNENAYYEQVNEKQAGRFFIQIGVIAGVVMVILGAVMLKFDKCCCIE